jgi:hypothetical protein
MQNETIKNSGHKQHKSSSVDLELHSPTITSSQLGKKKELASPYTTWVVVVFFCTETVATSSNCCTVVSSSGAATRENIPVKPETRGCLQKARTRRFSSKSWNLTTLGNSP